MMFNSRFTLICILNFFILMINNSCNSSLWKPCIVATWDFGKIAIEAGIDFIHNNYDNPSHAIDIIEKCINAVEMDTRDQYFVGYGGLPNADGVMQLDAAIMNHQSQYGAVMCLENIKTPISVARKILEKCPHNILIGEGAMKWAIAEGFKIEDILTDKSKEEWQQWRNSIQQKNTTTTNNNNNITNAIIIEPSLDESSHDTIGVICLDENGYLAAGTSTSGWKFKIPGRVGDSPLIGSGLYCDGAVGAAVATGDGEEIMRTCLSFLVVEYIRQGFKVGEACKLSIKRLQAIVSATKLQDNISLATMHSSLIVGVVAVDKYGNIGAASTIDALNPHRNRPYFPVTYWRSKTLANNSNNNSNNEQSNIEILQASIEGTQI